MKSTGQGNPDKKHYVAPQLTVHGDVSTITLSSSSGTFADSTIEAGQSILDHLMSQ